jgi:DNA-directed RNA polymerase specialized sigma24 family protein
LNKPDIRQEAWKFVEKMRGDCEKLLSVNCTKQEAQDAVSRASIGFVRNAHNVDREKWARYLRKSCWAARVDIIRSDMRRLRETSRVVLSGTYAAIFSTEGVSFDEGFGEAEIMAVVDSMPNEATRSVIQLRIRGYSFTEIGEELGITDNAARCRAIRGRDELEGYL